MSTPKEFGDALTRGFADLDAVAPPNSKALVMGLVDGRILWNEMSQRYVYYFLNTF